jgi:hypothetical protein
MATLPDRIRAEAERLQDEIVERLKEIVEIGSMLDTPEEQTVQVGYVWCFCSVGRLLTRKGLHGKLPAGARLHCGSVGCGHNAAGGTPGLLAARERRDQEGD